MLLQTDLPPLWKLYATAAYWSVFRPTEGGVPTPEGSLAAFLDSWAWQVESRPGPFDWNAEPLDSGRDEVQLWLETIALAADTLLAFRKREIEIAVSPLFLRCANRVFAAAEARGLRTQAYPLIQVAGRLSAATASRSPMSRAITVDERGRAFDLASGERLFHYNPATVLRGREDIASGRTQSLADLRAGEGRNGRLD